MPNQPPGTAEIIARELTLAFKPLETKFNSGNIRATLASLGLRLPEALQAQAGFMNALGDTITQIAKIPTLVIRLKDAIEQEKLADALSVIIDIGKFIADASTAIQKVSTELNNVSGSMPGVNAGEITAFAAALPKKLTEYLFIYHLESYYPIFSNVLNLLGFIEYEEVAGNPADNSKPPFKKRILSLNKIGGFIQDPSSYLKTKYQWGAAGFDGKKLFENLYKLFCTLGIPVVYKRPLNPVDKPSFALAFLTIEPLVTGDKGLHFVLNPAFSSSIDIRVPFIQNNWFIEFDLEGALSAKTAIDILATGKILVHASSATQGKLGLHFVAVPPAGKKEFLILGQSAGSRVTCSEIKFGLASAFLWNGVEANGDFAVEAAIKDGRIIIDMSKSDGFIGKLLGGVKVDSHFDLIAGISASKGLYFGGSSALEIRLPLHVELGPVSLEGLTLTLKPKDGKFPISLGLDIKAALGPIVAVVQDIGMTANFSFPSDGKGNLGPVQLGFEFKPPSGVGLSVDTGVIKGGGFLRLDFDKGEYYGALELSFQGIISLKAIGIINTKFPDGKKGFALLILITAEFTPIQLSFGFTLNGVGGLIGVNRSTDIDSLKNGVRTGALNSILFPQDIVANINTIISDLKSIFPIVEDHFLIAPMAKLGWGTPPLITLELGIIIDIPTPRIIILGVLRCILPTEEAAILKLQVNFAGGIDFEKGMIWFDASLFDSRILIYTLTGDMALRIGWKTPMFVLSVGGFHPAFKEVPPDLTGMRRIMISLLSGDNPRLNAQTYFAITSNSVQSGAKVELYAEACGFNVYGFLGYDLLVQFNPFHFIADIYAGLALRSGNDEIAGIHVHCQLSGPTPWNAKGDASISFFFFDVSVGFDVTWGETGPSQPQELEDVLKLVREALNDDRNWKADLPANSNQGVTLRKIQLAETEIIVHPFGILAVSQKIVPLGVTINKFGNKKPSADTLFNLTYAGGGSPSDVKEEFAMANFIQMSDSEKVSRKSFEKIKSGLTLTPSNGTLSGATIHKDVTYELSYVHKKKMITIRIRKFLLFVTTFNIFVKGSAVTKNAYAVNKKANTVGPAKVELPEQKYSVVNVSDLQLHASGMEATSEAEAFAMHDTLISKNPSLKGTIQVVSNFELN